MKLQNLYCKMGLHKSVEYKKIIPLRESPYYETLSKTQCIHCGKILKTEVY